ncbi:MAG: nickel-dependent lactate racemase [Thermodesulfobacteriota bacterium]
MQVTMHYGRKGLPLSLPDDWDVTIIKKKPMPILPEPLKALEEAFDRPVGCRRLLEEARGKHRVCILICDITRPAPNGLILPVLLGRLLDSGLAKEQIRVLVATGLHRPNEGRELKEVVGDDWVLDNFTIENHFARHDQDHVSLGYTSLGTPIKLDKRFVEADLRIVVGLVEPHFMAGYSGGRKIIMPGVAHQETITFLHSATFMEHPRSVNRVLAGNPLHEQQLEIVNVLGGALAVNVVLDEHRRLSFVNFGEIVVSHLQAVAHIRPHAEVPAPKRFRTVITSSAGYPLDKTYYQTVKGMVGAQEILEPGGDLFIVSEISEGLGSPEYLEAQKKLIALGPEGFLEYIKPKKHADMDEWQTEEQLKPMRLGRIFLFTEGLTPEERSLTGVTIVSDLEAAIHESAKDHRRVAVIPEGPYVLPFIEREGPTDA